MIHHHMKLSLSLYKSFSHTTFFPYLWFQRMYYYIASSKDQRESIMGDSSASYIHMVQHLIEKCLIFHMTKEECMEALSKHATIEPVITSTVWNELEKENKEFFEAYSQSQGKEDRMSEAETSEMIQKMISDSSKDTSD